MRARAARAAQIFQPRLKLAARAASSRVAAVAMDYIIRHFSFEISALRYATLADNYFSAVTGDQIRKMEYTLYHAAAQEMPARRSFHVFHRLHVWTGLTKRRHYAYQLLPPSLTITRLFSSFPSAATVA